MNTAEILQFPSETGGQEKRVADTDDGFTRLANELYEELIGANLTRNQAKVAHAVCRKTYGFNKKMDRIADSQIALITRLPRQKVNKAKNELIAMKVLLKEGQLIGPNKSLSEWQIPECHLNNVSVTTVVTKDVTKTVTALSLKQGHTKDTITKDNKDIKKILPKPAKSPSEKTSKSTQRPAGFSPSEAHTEMASEMGVNLQSEFGAFCDYHEAKGSTFKSWDAALRTWIRNAAKFSGKSNRGTQGKNPTTPARATADNFSAKNYGVTDAPGWMEE
ncbi:TPA: replication protein [Yersinia enterocolitica]|nr:replication protein [Yersinia enterocolitica]HDL7834248.1 replication protein [Yersinia enterocolitica]HDL7875100.1 replication protein [Yersinia enterocolitica]HDL7887668.1 replication protein [Yersinia enterocolitica]HDL7896269.1 replication protein [Yersinia enterocolitica]